MNRTVEPMQQPVRKVVGRPPSASQRLALLEEFNRFVEKHARHGIPPKPEGDYFPVRKVVGRADRRQG
jgi:hypothetical protein